ncbi:hypothetical protein PTSG_00148 [Salpingoeca rosetta]|uniref:HMG box domain-containing protein n=1 Tax=Salpingoeca rosetta (strain ATCC 50818 / BSB-021) TaxID=946362 RepID=F2TVN2_SALR5|nr:uncharacterized protein PTSG_00148 [Salpingoeca rosetta]EGD72128.1 hypothetical protein PTSG_00148 [Salpingoeca rosetta]|eukprot:XP_004998700.1 hypothetical protein PTSG_00148 [Salpingoeca rosetta]
MAGCSTSNSLHLPSLFHGLADMTFARFLGLAARTRVQTLAVVQTRTFFSSATVLAHKYPRRVKSSFFLFSDDVRDDVVKQNPDMPAHHVVTEVARRFKELPAEARAVGSHLNTQLKRIAEQRGMSATIDSLNEIRHTLSEEEKEKLRQERVRSAEEVAPLQEAWDNAHREGLAEQRKLEEKFAYRASMRDWFTIAKKRRWKAVADFADKYEDLSDIERQQVADLRHAHKKRAKRHILRTLRDAGYNDEAESF